jgi:hypothetical protein
LKEHKASIAKFAFVFYVIPAGLHGKPVPVQLIKATSGAANQSLVGTALNTIQNLKNLGFRARSLAFDGDRFYLSLVEKFYEFIRPRIGMFNLQIGKLADGYQGVLPIEDPLHLEKTDRYRRVSDRPQYAYLTASHPTLERHLLSWIGMPASVLSDEKFDKMVDDLPLKMFSVKFLVDAYAWNRYDLFVALLPSTLLNVAFFRPSISRLERLRCLSMATAVVSFYAESLCCWTGMTPLERQTPPRMQPQTMNKSGTGLPMTLWSMEYCKKLLTLAAVLANHIEYDNEVNLAAIGTHLLEHFFGEQRSVSHGDDSWKCFERNVIQTLLVRELKTEVKVRDAIKGRISDSGMKLSDPINAPCQAMPSIGVDLVFAMRLFAKIGPLPAFPFILDICAYATENGIESTVENFIKNWLPSVTRKQPKSTSTSSTHICVNGSSAATWRLKRMSQLPK